MDEIYLFLKSITNIISVRPECTTSNDLEGEHIKLGN